MKIPTKTLLIVLGSLLLSCERDVIPTAGFETDFYIDYNWLGAKKQNIPRYATNEQIKFTNQSTNAASYFWDFGNGQTSTEKEPLISYAAGGEYTVQLVVESETGNLAFFNESLKIHERYIDKISVNLMVWDFNLTNMDDLGWEEDAVMDVILELGILQADDFLVPKTILFADTIPNLYPGAPIFSILPEAKIRIDYNTIYTLEKPRPMYVLQLSAIHDGEKRLFYSSEYYPGMNGYVDFETGLFKLISGVTIDIDCHFE